MELGLEGKRALITGGSRGIGLAVAQVLAREGCDIVIAARDPGSLRDAQTVLAADGHRATQTCTVDLSTAEGIAELQEAAGQIDILVNNAGAIPPGDLATVDGARWRAAWDLKVYGFIDLSRALYATLAARRGVIVNIIGVAGETFPADYIAGATGNAALMAFTRALGRAAPRDGMRVVGVNPGPVATERLEMLMRAQAATKLGDEARWRELAATMPFGRFAQPAEIADAVAFLASPRSAYTSGTVLTINGGCG